MITQIIKKEEKIGQSGKPFVKIEIAPKFEGKIAFFNLFRQNCELGKWYNLEVAQRGQYYDVISLTPAEPPKNGGSNPNEAGSAPNDEYPRARCICFRTMILRSNTIERGKRVACGVFGPNQQHFGRTQVAKSDPNEFSHPTQIFHGMTQNQKEEEPCQA